MEPLLEDPPLRQLDNSDRIQEYWAVILFALIVFHIVLQLCFCCRPKSAAMDKICHKSAFVYVTQMMVNLGVVIEAVINLSKTQDNNKEMWIFILCSMIGYLLPNAKLKRTYNTQAETIEQN